MNLILIFEEDLVGGTNRVRLKGRRHRHILEIHKPSVGDTLCVGMVNGKIGQGRVTYLDDTEVELAVELENEPLAALPLVLILALPRPPVLKRVLLTAASMGVKKIILLNARRVEKPFWQSHAVQEKEIQEQLILGLEQARDTVMPEVLLRPRFKPFVDKIRCQALLGDT